MQGRGETVLRSGVDRPLLYLTPAGSTLTTEAFKGTVEPGWLQTQIQAGDKKRSVYPGALGTRKRSARSRNSSTHESASPGTTASSSVSGKSILW